MKPDKKERPRWLRILLPNLYASFFIIFVLVYENYVVKNFAWSHAVALIVVLVLTDIYYIFQFKSLIHKLADITGLEGKFNQRTSYGFAIGVFLSISFLIAGTATPIPPLMQFQLVTVSATLGGLVIASSNFSSISKETRLELLKVGQQLVTAAVSFIFFVGLFVFVNLSNIDPGTFEWGWEAIIRGLIFWFAVFFFYGGASIFTIGIIDLVLVLKNLKHEIVDSKNNTGVAAKSKYGNYVVTELKTPPFPAEAVARYNTFARRILWVDKNVVPGAFQMNCSWYQKRLEKGPPAHTHDVGEIIGFFSNDSNNPYDLGGEVEIWLEGEKQLITKSALVFIPAGMNHCPLILKRVDRPIFHFSVVTSGEYIIKPTTENKVPKSTYSNYIVTELKEPEERRKRTEEYNKYARRILWMDEDVVPGSFNLNTSWYLNAAVTWDDKPHTHKKDEIIGFFSNDPDNPYDLGGEIEIWLEDEKQIITKSAMLFIPAGMYHCPLILRRVTRPIFHFTVLVAPRYKKIEK
jgi:quercetin dioxygenase-like cupin family protein